MDKRANKSHPNIVIGPLTLKWSTDGAGRGYMGKLGEALFIVSPVRNKWWWFCFADKTRVREAAPTLERATQDIRGFLTALGIISE